MRGSITQRERQEKSGQSPFLAGVIALAIFGIYSIYSYFQYKHFIIPSWDLGIFTQLADSYARGQAPIVPIKGAGFNLWGDHFHPILILLTPFYYFFPSPATLLYIQNALVALSVFFFFRFAQRTLGQLTAFLLTLAYSLSFGIQQAISVQFHEVAFALPFLVLSLGNLVLATGVGREEESAKIAQSRIRRALFWALPLVFVKEDMGITVAAIGVVALLRSGWLKQSREILFPHAHHSSDGWEQRLKLLGRFYVKQGVALEASLTILWGLAWSLLAVSVILPYFNTSGQFDYADKVDFAGALGDPLQAIAALFFPWTKLFSLLLLLIIGAVCWIFSPLALIALPTLIWRFLSPNEGYWESTWHYSLVLMPIVFLALIDVLHHPPVFLAKIGTKFSPYVVKTTTAALACTVALVMIPQQPLKDLANPQFVRTDASAVDEAKQKVVDAIPAHSVVASDLSVLTYLIPEHTVYWIGHAGEPAPDYVVIDIDGTSWGSNPPADPVAYAAQRYKTPYVVEQKVGSIYIVKKVIS